MSVDDGALVQHIWPAVGLYRQFHHCYITSRCCLYHILIHTADPYHLTWIWTWPGMGQCLDLHADVTFQWRARPPFWDLPQTQHITNHGRSGLRATQLSLTLHDRAHSSQETRVSQECNEVSRFVVSPIRGGLEDLVYVGPWQLSSPRTSKLTLVLFRIGNWFEWIGFSSALPQTRDNRRSTRTGDTAGKVVECVYRKWAFVFTVLPTSPVCCLLSGSLTLAINWVIVPPGAGRAVSCLTAPHFQV